MKISILNSNTPVIMQNKINQVLSLLFAILIFSCGGYQKAVQPLSYEMEVQAFRKELNDKYSKAATSPLKPEQRKVFKGHDFFPIDKVYKIESKFVRTPDAEVFKMKTSSDRLPDYVKYGELQFQMNGEDHKLALYQNLATARIGQYKDHLFLPFKDETNGEESYGGGRYIDFKIPKSDEVLLDFNKSYNPYCAYTDGYSCPIPPLENHLSFAVKAGIKKFK